MAKGAAFLGVVVSAVALNVATADANDPKTMPAKCVAFQKDEARGVNVAGLPVSLEVKLAELKASPKDHVILFTALPDPKTSPALSATIRLFREQAFTRYLESVGLAKERFMPVRTAYPDPLPTFGSLEFPGEGDLVCGIYVTTAIPRNAHAGLFADELMKALFGFPQANGPY